MSRKYTLMLTACLLCAACSPASNGAASNGAESPPSQSETVSRAAVSGTEINQEGWSTFEVVGQGPDVILLPGLASDAEVWRSTVDELSDQYRFHVADVAGFAGNPVGAPREAVVSGLADDVAAYINAAQLDQPVLVGHSLGGFTALTTALRYDDAVSAVISVDSLPFYPLIFDPAASEASMQPITAGMRAQMQAMTDADYDAMQARTSSIYAKSPEAVARIIEWGQTSDRGVVLDAITDLMTTDLRSELANMPVPVTVIYAYDEGMGRPTAAVDALYDTAYERVPDLTLTRVDDSFHFIMDDQPKNFITALSERLADYTGD